MRSYGYADIESIIAEVNFTLEQAAETTTIPSSAVLEEKSGEANTSATSMSTILSTLHALKETLITEQ